jgi:hypothetical protein
VAEPVQLSSHPLRAWASLHADQSFWSGREKLLPSFAVRRSFNRPEKIVFQQPNRQRGAKLKARYFGPFFWNNSKTGCARDFHDIDAEGNGNADGYACVAAMRKFAYFRLVRGAFSEKYSEYVVE